MNEKIKKIAEKFEFQGTLTNIEENNQGNINKSYILTYKDKEERKYLLQKINSNVFTEPYLVMKNIELVTNHIKKNLKKTHDNIHKTLNIIKTKSGENLYTYTNHEGEKEYYRAFDYIDNCISYDSFKDAKNSRLPQIIRYKKHCKPLL